MTARLLLIDDDARLTAMIGDYLRGNGYAVDTAGSLAAGRERLKAGGYDALVLDLMLPDGDGLDLTREVRADPRLKRLPLLMLTARGEPLDRVVGLELGADDYLPKPFEPRELVARIRAVLRRGQAVAAAAGTASRFAGWHFDRLQRSLRAPDGTVVPLSAAEFRLLGAFIEHAGQALSRERLLQLTQAGGAGGGASGRGAAASERSIDLAVSRLRGKLGDVGGVPLIRTLRGAGYVFDPPPDSA